ncbi:MAG: hypothetical protein ACE5G2_03950, partial [Candidatus Krumholzibacteriia bacterium]
DRRATLLSATDKARDLVRRYEALKAERLSPVLQKFRPDEIRQLTSLLKRFSVSLYEKEASGESFCLRCAAYGEEDCPVGHILGNCPYQKMRSRSHTSPGIEEGPG